MSLEQYARLTGDVEAKLDEADKEAAETDVRLSQKEVFGNVRRRLNGKV
jgi:hypothetical protein